jgi:hypothetical protein
MSNALTPSSHSVVTPVLDNAVGGGGAWFTCRITTTRCVETGGATEWLVRGAELVRGAGELVITVLLLVTGEDDGGGLVGGTSLVEGGLVGVLDGD